MVSSQTFTLEIVGYGLTKYLTITFNQAPNLCASAVVFPINIVSKLYAIKMTGGVRRGRFYEAADFEL